jgi:hypothetical protein
MRKINLGEAKYLINDQTPQTYESKPPAHNPAAHSLLCITLGNLLFSLSHAMLIILQVNK